MIVIFSLDFWIVCLKKNEFKSNIDLIFVGFYFVIFVVFKFKILVMLCSVLLVYLLVFWDDINKFKIYFNGSLMCINLVVFRFLIVFFY